uniref:Uncharacterized protein n=1 Tax=Glossina austeni TaxID=7395 RepID=A0A1A9VQE7_GLOAU
MEIFSSCTHDINSRAPPLTALKKDEEIYYQLRLIKIWFWLRICHMRATPNDPNTEEDLGSDPFNSVPWNEIELAFTPTQTKCFALSNGALNREVESNSDIQIYNRFITKQFNHDIISINYLNNRVLLRGCLEMNEKIYEEVGQLLHLKILKHNLHELSSALGTSGTDIVEECSTP